MPLNLNLITSSELELSPLPGEVALFGFETEDFSGFTTQGNVTTPSADFGPLPTEGSFQALLSTRAFGVSETGIEEFLGLQFESLDSLGNGDATTGSSIRLDSLTVQAGDVLSFDFNFLTNEGTPSFSFNDFAFVAIADVSTLANTNAIFSISPSVFGQETGYQRFEFTFDTAGTFNIGFGVINVGDTFVDSGLLLDNIRLFPELVGTGAADQLNGITVSERVIGGGGNDIIYGNGGFDVLLGGGGHDRIAGGSDSDFIDGGNGRDFLWGNGGEDTLVGGKGNDTIYGGADADNILAGEGNDTIFANGGGDTIDSGIGLDTVWLGGEATVILAVGSGFDTIKNFQLGSTVLDVSDVNNLSFADSVNGARIFQSGDLLAVIDSQSAGSLSNNLDVIFA